MNQAKKQGFRVLTTHQINFPDCGYVDGLRFACYCVPPECGLPIEAYSPSCRFYKKINGFNVCTRFKPVQLEIKFSYDLS